MLFQTNYGLQAALGSPWSHVGIVLESGGVPLLWHVCPGKAPTLESLREVLCKALWNGNHAVAIRQLHGAMSPCPKMFRSFVKVTMMKRSNYKWTVWKQCVEFLVSVQLPGTGKRFRAAFCAGLVARTLMWLGALRPQIDCVVLPSDFAKDDATALCFYNGYALGPMTQVML